MAVNFDRSSDEELLEALAPAVAGEAFEQFYLRHHKLVLMFHYRVVGDVELAADLTAETFAQVLTARLRFRSRGEGSSIRWLYTIAANVRANSARRAAREQRAAEALGIEREPLSPHDTQRVIDASSTEGVLALLEEMPLQQREAVRAYVLGDLSYEEIASSSGTTPATVRKRVSRGLSSLRRALKEPA